MQRFINKLLRNYRKGFSIILTFSLLLPNFLAPIGVLPVFAASTECVGSGVGCHSSLQDAINAVDAGGTINIEAGTFNPTSTVNVNKSVTIQGAGRDLTTINASGYAGYGISVTANNVVLRDFTFTGSTHYGLKISGNSNVSLLNLRVTNSARTNIDFNGTDNVVVNNVISTGAVSGNALSITDGENFTISNFTSSGNAWGGIALYTSTYYPPAGVNNVTLGTGISISDSPRMYSEVRNIGEPITNINYSNSLFRYVVTNPALPKYKWYAYASDYAAITSVAGNVVYDNVLGYIVFPAPAAPTTLGINVQSLSTLPSDTPVAVSCGAYTNDNTPAHVWTASAGTNIKYQRQAQPPAGGWWTDPVIYSSTNTNWLWFMTAGQGNGLDGAWKLRVRAFEDNNSNGVLDSTDSVSAWSNECVVNYDDTKPTVPTILQPTESSAFNATPILNDWSDSTDINGIAKYIIEYQYDDGHTFAGGPYRESLVSQRNHTPAMSEEGGVKFRVSAVDNVGNQGDWSDWRHYFYDITQASSSFITPMNDSKYNEPIEISGLTTDNVGVDKVSIYYKNTTDADDPANWVKITDLFNTAKDTPYNWSYVWTPSNDGSYDLKVHGFDTAGNVENTGYAYNVLYDTTDPVVDITSHVNGNVLKGNVNIAGTVNDTNLWRYYFVIQNASNTTVAGPGTVYNAGPLVNVSLNWDTTLVPDGTYRIRLEARDIANNKGTSSVEVVTVVVDNSAPTTPKLVNTPFVTHNGDLTYSGGNVRNEVKFSESSDLSGVSRYEYQFVRLDLNGNKLQQGLANMNTYLGGISCVSGVCTWRPDYQNNNQWVFRIRAIDVVGNVSAWSNWNDATDTQFYSFTTTYNQYLSNSGIFARSDYDSTVGNGGYAVRESIKPVSNIVSPSGVFSTNNPNINITYSASDTGSAVKNVKLYSQAGDLLATSSNGEFNITLPSVDGSYCMYTRAEDISDDKLLDAGNGNIEDIDNNCELEVRLDVTAPTVGNISFIMDYSPYLFGNGFMVTAPVSDSFSGVDNTTCEFTFDGGSTWEAGSYAAGNCVAMKTTPNNVILTVNARVSDNVGNTNSGTPKVRTSDSENPVTVVNIDNTYYGPNLYPVNTIKGLATDSVSNIEALSIMIRRSSDNRYWNGSTFGCMLCVLPQMRTVSRSMLPNWVYNGLPSTALSNGVTYLVTPIARDSVMHIATGSSDAFVWDSVAPVNPVDVSTSHESPTNTNIIYASWPEIEVLGGAYDNLSGVKGYSYVWSQNATDVVDDVMDIDNTITNINSGVVADGNWYLHIRTVDNVNNWSSVSSFGPYMVDTVAPVTTVSGIDADWHNTPVTVTFTCTDTDGSGCFKTFYSINGGTFVEGNSVEISTEGYNQVDFYSVDNAGNSEVTVVYPQTVNIDVTSPVNPSEFVSDPDINISTQDNTVWITWISGMVPAGTVSPMITSGAYDNLSGVKQFQYKFSMIELDSVNEFDPTTTAYDVTSEPLTDGVWYFHMRTEDNANNFSDTTSYGPFIIDNTKPVITRNGTDVTITQGQTYTDAGATAFDTQDGNITASIVTVNPVNTNVLGVYTVTYNVTDSAGNIADQVTRTVTVVAAPVIPAVAGVDDEQEVVVQEENNNEEEEGEVLGVCTVSMKVSGFIYLDKDNNGKRDSDESGVSDIEVIIYAKSDNKEITKVKTDSDGKWSVEVCSGQYYAKISNPKDVKGFKIESDSIDFEVKDGTDIQDLNFVYENTSKFNWWWLVLLALVVISAGGYIYLSRRRKDEK